MTFYEVCKQSESLQLSPHALDSVIMVEWTNLPQIMSLHLLGFDVGEDLQISVFFQWT